MYYLHYFYILGCCFLTHLDRIRRVRQLRFRIFNRSTTMLTKWSFVDLIVSLFVCFFAHPASMHWLVNIVFSLKTLELNGPNWYQSVWWDEKISCENIMLQSFHLVRQKWKLEYHLNISARIILGTRMNAIFEI